MTILISKGGVTGSDSYKTVKNALKDLGMASIDKNKSQEDYATYFERQDKCNICKAKVTLMKKMINRMEEMFGPQAPMLSAAKL